jgi:hypothetical protein
MRYAKKLDNCDEVEVRLGPGEWVPGYVLGSPKMVGTRLIIPVMSSQGGFQEVDYTDVR